MGHFLEISCIFEVVLQYVSNIYNTCACSDKQADRNMHAHQRHVQADGEQPGDTNVLAHV